MQCIIRPFESRDISDMVAIWNSVVLDGCAFPQEECLTLASGEAFFSSQSLTAVACDAESEAVLGLYILHPNNIGRCGHICNASFAVSKTIRGNHIGEALVTDCLSRARSYGFRILQFNAVVASNGPARMLYEKLGFIQLGTIPGGFRLPDGTYQDICPYYHIL